MAVSRRRYITALSRVASKAPLSADIDNRDWSVAQTRNLVHDSWATVETLALA